MPTSRIIRFHGWIHGVSRLGTQTQRHLPTSLEGLGLLQVPDNGLEISLAPSNLQVREICAGMFLMRITAALRVQRSLIGKL